MKSTTAPDESSSLIMTVQKVSSNLSGVDRKLFHLYIKYFFIPFVYVSMIYLFILAVKDNDKKQH